MEKLSYKYWQRWEGEKEKKEKQEYARQIIEWNVIYPCVLQQQYEQPTLTQFAYCGNLKLRIDWVLSEFSMGYTAWLNISQKFENFSSWNFVNMSSRVYLYQFRHEKQTNTWYLFGIYYISTRGTDCKLCRVESETSVNTINTFFIKRIRRGDSQWGMWIERGGVKREGGGRWVERQLTWHLFYNESEKEMTWGL